MWGMPDGFAELLRRKYEIMQQGADTQEMGVRADANLAGVKAGLMPAESLAERAKLAADTAGTLESNKYIGDLARSGIALQGAQGFGARSGGLLDRANIGRVGAETDTLRDSMRTGRFGMQSFGSSLSDDRLRRGERIGLTGYPLLR